MPPNEEGLQRGHYPGNFGHVLPGLTVRQEGTALVFSQLFAGNSTPVRLERLILDPEGFVIIAPPAKVPRDTIRTT
jgi:hypothetical protein